MKKFLSMVLALVMTMSLVTVSAGAKEFKDDSKINYDEAVAVISAAKVVDGYTDGTFNPQNQLTRGAAAKIICNLILGPTTAAALSADTAPYKDIATNSTFAGYIAYCKQQGIISGYADGTFRAAAPLTGYAFMKMLLGALGYDGAVEGYTGANWSIAVAKRALNIGLDDGLKGTFVGTKPVTREEAALYAFNTLQADMVEYDTTIHIGDVTVAGSKAEVSAQGSYKNTMNKAGLQFAEKYFQDLKKVEGTDDFARPATTWKVKTEKVGTYTSTPDASYVGKVELGTIYNDLGMSNKDSAEYNIDGAEQASVLVKKGSDVEIGGNGTQVEVYIDSDTNDVTICVINTWVGTVNKSVEATASKDAYIVIDEADKAPEGFKAEYETDEKFEDDAVVLYTYSMTADSIQSVEVAESVEGTLTKKIDGKGLSLNDTAYKYSAQYSFDAGLTEAGLTAKSDYVVYLDNDGNVIYVEEVEFVSNDYAMILAIEGEATGGKFATNRAKVVFADGTVKTIDLEKDYEDKGIEAGDVVTWKVNDAKEYTLKATKDVSGVTSTFKVEKGEARMTVAGATIYADSKTVFVVKNHSGDWDVYTGIKNVPSIDANGNKVPVSYFCKTDKMATIMFIDASNKGVSISSSSKDVIFLAGESASKLITDKDDNEYYEYNAVVNGEITTVKVQKGTDLSKGTAVATSGKGDVQNYLFGAAEYTDGMISKLTAHDLGMAAKTTKKLSGDYTVSIGGRAYTVAEDAKIFKVDEDGVITESTLKNIKNDDNDTVLFVYDDGALTYIFVQEIAAGEDPSDTEIPGKTEIRYVSVDLAQQKIVLNKADEIKHPGEWTADEKAAFEGAAKAALYSEGWMATGHVTYGEPNTINAVERGSAQSREITFEIVWG